ncbi:biotin--protein ligase-like isoform X2 [Amphiura filiformis]|uniref:biotin--protein ligase-like isoform X2 n=1 Tax=Amphiura filiformis TaxID=82378 RepID=UPI003B22351C
MLITICYTYLTVSHWYRQYRQRCLVMNAIRSHGTRASIAFWKIGRWEVNEGVSVVARVSQLCERLGSELVTEVLHEKRGKQMMTLHPKHYADLSKEWTSFLGTHTPPTVYAPEQVLGPPVFILLEASPPPKDSRGRPSVRKVQRERVIKLSSLTTPLAWKSGEPFGILVEASVDNFSMVGSAYLDGVLELDDGLLVDQIVTVDIKGKPFDLLKEEKKLKVPDQPPIEGAPLRRVPSGGNLKATLHRVPSGNKLDSAASVSGDSSPGKQLRRKHSAEFLRKVEERQKKPPVQRPPPVVKKVEEKTKVVEEIPKKVTPVPLQNGHNSLKEVPKPKETTPVKKKTEGSSINHKATTNGMASKQNGDDQAPSLGHRKPPNVLIYTGPDDSDPSKYDSTKLALEQCLLSDRYVIYRLTHKQILTTPWVENCALLVLASSSKVRQSESDRFMQYIKSGGMLLSFGGAFAIATMQHEGPASYQQVSEVTYNSSGTENPMTLMALLSRGGIPCGTGKGITVATLAECQGQAVLAEVQFEDCEGKAILSQVHLEMSSEEMLQDTAAFTELKKSSEYRRQVLMDVLSHLSLQCGACMVPKLTPGYVLGESKKFVDALQPDLKDGKLPGKTVTLEFCPSTSDIKQEVTPDLLPLVYNETPSHDVPFDMVVYQANLETQVLGNLVLYAEVLPTTMTVFEGFLFKVPADVGAVSIATRMTVGRGRGGNKWIAPAGCAMFSLHVRVPGGSELADKLPFLQHIASAAVVEAVRTLPGYEEIDLRLKWPNDIYFSDSIKLGGVIVNSSMMDGMFHAIIGCGFNVSNSDPTICINDLIHLHNKQTGSNLALCTTEQLIARTISIIEKMVQRFQRQGAESFLPIYYKRWLHSGAQVRLESETGPQVTVMGLDHAGFLAVKGQDGDLRSVQPDGNSFDMTKNLVLMKQR